MAKKALLVGINDYQQINDLNGCINDVSNMREILKTYFNFKNTDIRVLVDKRATKKNILDRLKKLVSSAKAGDYIVFHFSGHGSQIRDRNNDELKDHMDELICPYDMNWDNAFITDDTLGEIFNGVAQNVTLEVFLDCCHSGTGLRDIASGTTNSNSSNTDSSHHASIRYLPPPFDIRCRHEGEQNELKPTKKFQSKNGSLSNYILWGGCKDNQTSDDAFIDGSYNGAFTYYLCKTIRSANGKISRKKLLTTLRTSMKKNHHSQIPQLECQKTFDDGNILTVLTK